MAKERASSPKSAAGSHAQPGAAPSPESTARKSRPTKSLPVAQVHLAFEASHEIHQLAAHLMRLVDAANLDEGVLWRGMLARVKQLAESISACVDDDPEGTYGTPIDQLTELIIGDVDAGRQLLSAVERTS